MKERILKCMIFGALGNLQISENFLWFYRVLGRFRHRVVWKVVAKVGT
jgi:hypothetical protein